MTSTQDIYKLFKAYDIRGDISILSEEIYYLVGEGIVKEILIPENLPLKIVAGKDGRLTSDKFFNAFCQGAIDAGCQIIPIGLCTTEIVYSSCINENCTGVMVTASHNPKNDNGLKIVKKIPQMLGLNTGLSKIRDYVLDKIEGFTLPINISELSIEEAKLNSALKYWIEKVQSIGEISHTDETLSSSNKRLKVVVDCGNGVGGFLMERIIGLYKNIDFIPLYWQIDGNFPNHPADPIKEENLADLKKSVIENKADLGIAMDGDADRAFFVDQNGKLLKNELLCGLFSSFMGEYVKKQISDNPDYKYNDAIVFTTPYSSCIPNSIIQSGCVAIPSIVGHTFIKKKMQKYNAIYGSEASGHHYFGEFNFMDSGGMTIALMLKILVKTDMKASELLTKLSKDYFVSGEQNIRLTENVTIDSIKSKIKAQFNDANYWEEDGIVCFYPDWKFSVRLSNTEPIARINVETIKNDFTKEKLNQILNIVQSDV